MMVLSPHQGELLTLGWFLPAARWDQGYLVFGWGLVPSAFVAAIPIFTLLWLLGVMRKAAWIAGLSGLSITFVLAIGVYRMPAVPAVSAAANGAAFGLFPISWIVFWAIALYRVTVDTGKFDIIRQSLGQLTSEPYLQILLIAFAFGAFIEGAAGFGTPVAIAAAMLTGLGFSPFRASGACLLANTSPVAFGSIGIPIVTLAGITSLPVDRLSAMAGRLCAPMSLIIPAYLVLAVGGWSALRSVWKMALMVGAVFAVTQFLVSNYAGPQLADILASIAAIIAMVGMLRVRRSREQTVSGVDRVTVTESVVVIDDESGNGEAVVATRAAVLQQAPATVGAMVSAWLPYGFLVVCVLVWGTHPVQQWFGRAGFTFPWPFLHGIVRRMPPIAAVPTAYPAIFNVNWLTASGTSCMVATLLSAISVRMGAAQFLRLLISVTRQLALPTVTVTSVLAMTFLMNYCGATATMGLAFASTRTLFPFFSALLGWLGVFLTGSDTSSNALFGNLQVVTATRLGLDPFLMAAVNSVGGVMGKMISLQTIAVAAAATGMSVPEQARLFRFTFRHSVILAAVVGLMAMLYAYIGVHG
jgi:L-lactate transport